MSDLSGIAAAYSIRHYVTPASFVVSPPNPVRYQNPLESADLVVTYMSVYDGAPVAGNAFTAERLSNGVTIWSFVETANQVGYQWNGQAVFSFNEGMNFVFAGAEFVSVEIAGFFIPATGHSV